jgi:hypothetical protein
VSAATLAASRAGQPNSAVSRPARDATGAPADQRSQWTSDNVDYDGRFTFVRLRYETGFGGGFGRGRRDPGWLHDYPTADHHLMKIVAELSLVSTRDEESNILTFDDPEIFKYPLLYMSEPGGWTVNDAEAKGLHDYLLKGGFIIFDDFREWDFQNLQDQFRRALPDARFVELDPAHPIFHSFFEINPKTFVPMYTNGAGAPVFYGVFEDNDPKKRLLVIANHNNDLGEYWEYSATGLVPVDLSNEAYKFGVNYVIYSMTH